MECDPISGRLQSDDRTGAEHRVALSLDPFAWETLTEQSRQMGVSVEELVSFSVLYYIADLDSKRIARLVPPAPRPLVDRG
jgi:hypothetical protein